MFKYDNTTIDRNVDGKKNTRRSRKIGSKSHFRLRAKKCAAPPAIKSYDDFNPPRKIKTLDLKRGQRVDHDFEPLEK